MSCNKMPTRQIGYAYVFVKALHFQLLDFINKESTALTAHLLHFVVQMEQLW